MALWLLPMLMLSGGYESYSMVSKELLTFTFSINSILFGADITRNLGMGMNLIGLSLIGMGVVNVAILITYVWHRFRTNLKWFNLKNTKIIFLVLWIFPAFIFYFLFYFEKPGYLLVYLPTYALILAYVYLDISHLLNRRFKGISKNTYIIFILLVCIITGTLQFANPNELSVDYGRIQAEDMNVQYFNNSLNMFNSTNTVIFTGDEDDWRKITYYFPEYEVYSSYARESAGKIFKGIRHYKPNQTDRNDQTEVSESEIREIHINPSITKILWLINDTEFLNNLKSKIDVKTIELPDGKEIYYSNVENVTNFQIYGFVFTRG